MKNKRIIYFLLLFIILFPVLLNLIISLPTPKWYSIVGEATDWLQFWTAYLTAIASVILIIITYSTLKQNENQLNEIKRQWKEENRPYLYVSVIKTISAEVLQHEFIFYNAGKTPAKNISFKFNDSWLQSIKESFPDKENKLRELSEHTKITNIYPKQGNKLPLNHIDLTASKNTRYEEHNALFEKILKDIVITFKYDGYEQTEEVNLLTASFYNTEIILAGIGNSLVDITGALKDKNTSESTNNDKITSPR